MKPVVKGPIDGNAFSVMGAVAKALRHAGQGHLVEEYRKKAMSGDYHHLLAVSMDYVDFDLDGGEESEDDYDDRMNNEQQEEAPEDE